MAAKWNSRVKCTKTRCFANSGGKCSLLRIRTKRQPCPFYRAIEELQEEELRLYGEVQHYKFDDDIQGC